MEGALIVIASAAICAYLFNIKGRSWVGGLFLGLFLNLVGVVIALFLKTRGTEGKDQEKPIKGKQDSIDSHVLTAQSKSAPIASKESVAHSRKSNLFVVPPSGYFGQEVAGESHHYGNIAKVSKSFGGQEEILTIAELQAEPSNKYDTNAISVIVNSLVVGYIPATETSKFHPVLRHLKKSEKGLGVHARIWRGEGYSGDQIASVSLDIPYELSTVIPVNELPRNGHLWPEGNWLQVSNESTYVSNVEPILASAYEPGICAAFFELRSSTNDKGKFVIEVFVDDLKVGDLSAVSAGKYGAAIQKIATSGSTTACLGIIRGNSLAVEITLNLLSPERLSADQIKILGL